MPSLKDRVPSPFHLPKTFGHMTLEHTATADGKSPQRLSIAVVLALLYGLAAAPVFVFAGPPMPAGSLIATAILAAGLIMASAIDFEHLRLPDALTLPLAATGIACAAAFQWGDPLMHVASAAAGFLGLFAAGWLYERLRGRPGLGLGDAKLLAASGAWLGAGGLSSVLLYACGLALIYALVLKLRDRATSLATAIPFGPFLAAGTWLVWLYGPLS